MNALKFPEVTEHSITWSFNRKARTSIVTDSYNKADRDAQMEREMDELRKRAVSGCELASARLVSHYGRHVKKLAARFFLPGAEREDLHQEGFEGLTLAIKTFDSKYGRCFTDYATLCIRNSLLRAVREATRKKRLMLTNAGEIKDSMPLVSHYGDPEEVATVKAMTADLTRKLREKLSKLELDALKRRSSGDSVEQIGEANHVSGKQVENALFRARQKARLVLTAWN